MITDILILTAVVSYSGFVIHRHIKNRKNPKAGCGGCSGCGGNCPGSGGNSYCNFKNTGK